MQHYNRTRHAFALSTYSSTLAIPNAVAHVRGAAVALLRRGRYIWRYIQWKTYTQQLFWFAETIAISLSNGRFIAYLLTFSMEQNPSREDKPGSRLVKKFPAFYGTRRFITAFTSARHLSLFWAPNYQSRSEAYCMNVS
jgi:hypothetical protein